MKYLYVELESSIYYNPNFTNNSEEIKNNVITALKEYASSMTLNKFGGRVKYSRITNIIDEVNEAITSNITRIKIRRNLNAAINQLAQYELCYGNRFHIKSGGYGIKSTGFTIEGNPDTLYLSDLPVDSSKGKIFFFKLDSTGNPNIVKVNAGTVDYTTGEILIDTVNITSTTVANNIIEVQAIPDSNDVIGLKDLYVQLNISSSSFEMVNDVISSGDNTAGTRFTTTSSFINGLYTR
jgi:hypothetical protein